MEGFGLESRKIGLLETMSLEDLLNDVGLENSLGCLEAHSVVEKVGHFAMEEDLVDYVTVEGNDTKNYRKLINFIIIKF